MIGDVPILAQAYEIADGRIVQIHNFVNPDKLRSAHSHVDLV